MPARYILDESVFRLYRIRSSLVSIDDDSGVRRIEEEHAQHLRVVLRRLREQKLMQVLQVCSFWAPVKWLNWGMWCQRGYFSRPEEDRGVFRVGMTNSAISIRISLFWAVINRVCSRIFLYCMPLTKLHRKVLPFVWWTSGKEELSEKLKKLRPRVSVGFAIKLQVLHCICDALRLDSDLLLMQEGRVMLIASRSLKPHEQELLVN
ncbi:PREDICTED: uncharacterized protein LOC109209898 [Nicotiana attenuata]|uniref:uncharacterized protein LOC109209898 n=1 Tax=Nicotiana attenuata TaxID=49451 RepID=UPI000905D870|nr:PREDICTED: uncharacterized protein LOC109209898 [Nicotiana attenuata]